MAEYTPQWNFDALKPGTMERNPVSEEFFTNDTRLEAVIRESIQNSIDANDATPFVRVRIYFSGADDALPAADYAKYRESGDKWFDDPGSGLLKPVPGKDEPCPFVVIEDFSTVGLTGDVDEKPMTPQSGPTRKDWNYYNYFFRENGTSKGAEGTLGSWGAGKCVFQRASRLKTSFALSVRDGYEPRKFLVGKATLQIHRDDSLVTWAPDGWFGTVEEPDDATPNRIVKRPITDEETIRRFAEDFNITRTDDQPGTSIVIPYVHLAESADDDSETFNKTNLVRSVLRNFLISIQKGELEVEIQVGKSGEVIFVNKDTFSESAAFLPEAGKKDSVVTRLHHALVDKAFGGSLPPDRVFDLAMPDGLYPKWTPGMFTADQLKALKKCLQQKDPVLVRVPMPVLKKGEAEPLRGRFDVAIMRADLARPLPPVFYRIGLLVYNVQPSFHSNCVAAVVVDRDPVADMLVAAEPPSHSEWHRDVDRLKAGYDKPWHHLQYVTHAVREILDAVAAADKEPDYDPLADVFGIPKTSDDSDDPVPAPDPKPTPKPGPGPTPPPNPPAEPKKRIVDIAGKSEGGLKGVRIFAGPGLAEAKSFPFTVRMKIGYDTYNGLDWSPFDFDLSANDRITITVEKGAGAVALLAKDNILVLTVNRPEDFEVSLVGFDPNRDLIVDKVRYDYGKEEE